MWVVFLFKKRMEDKTRLVIITTYLKIQNRRQIIDRMSRSINLLIGKKYIYLKPKSEGIYYSKINNWDVGKKTDIFKAPKLQWLLF
jgi:hypothetical protein